MKLQPDELSNIGIPATQDLLVIEPGTDLTPILLSVPMLPDTPVGQLLSAGAAITFGVPWLSAQANQDWFGRRLFVWTHGLPQQKLVGIVMSRIGRQPEQHQSVFDAIRTAIVRMDAGCECVLISRGTSAERHAARAAALFGRPSLFVSDQFADSGSQNGWQQFWDKVAERCSAASSTSQPTVYVSPEISPSVETTTPLCDRLLIGMSQRAICAHVKGRGHTFGLLHRRLTSNVWPAGSVLVHQQSKSRPVDKLLEVGAVGWMFLSQSQPSNSQAEDEPVEVTPHYTNFDHTQFLTHCTRRYDGPWPGESEEQFLDDLLLDRSGADHSALATLCRIVGQRKLLANNQMTRGDTKVVCFADCPATELVSRRTFRAHRGKWDYEPFGVCIRRRWLSKHGAKPVLYISKSDWNAIEPGHYWYYQTETTEDESVDWKTEREWRVPQDIDLSRIPNDDIFVFVPDHQSADAVRSVCPWPIVTLCSDDSDE